MTRKNLLMVGGAILAVVAVGAFMVLSYVQGLMAFVPLEISYATVQTQLPENVSCLGSETPGIAKEILNLETHDIYVAGSTNAMPDDVWANYSFRLPILQNSTRNLLFSGSCFFRSPDVGAGCVGEACFSIEEIVGYTWLKLTTVVGQSCFPNADGCRGDVVDPGYVSTTTIAKCQRLVFEGPTIYELTDDKGNVYVMHATGTGIPDVEGPTLPQGWTLAAREISEPLVLLPFGGGDDCYFNIIRDNLVQSYHQYVFVDDIYPSAN